ncbi:pancreatic triacylglycerol lipase [Callorhinchus milii]|uniref:pancreatic triacylglycerol lipase n=1 Tax=Callorhinchus milii TaxID=7868 RepID=UPI001C3F686A|nr:pancreatic triacylglycerol lipase [Callorhinchus milii]
MFQALFSQTQERALGAEACTRATMLPIVLTVLVLAHLIEADKVCYPRLGCFTNEPPWGGTDERPFKKLPWSSEDINIRFLLWTMKDTTNFQEITGTNPSSIESSHFDVTRKTRFIIHGFIDKGEEGWLSDMCKAMFKVENVNCICVDWKGGSRTLYSQAVSNIRVVGAEVAYLIGVFESQFNYSRSNIHVIGHSLGSHVAGEVGKRYAGLARITGLDPASPFFKDTPLEVRLDPSDAKFVDIIHSNAAPLFPYVGFGLLEPTGHIDFYPNGGKFMPGCDKNIISTIIDLEGIWEGTRDFAACHHLRSYKYYSESITTKKGFIGFPCDNYEDFSAGSCSSCASEGCPLMGHFADIYPFTNGVAQPKFYLNTGDAKPFSRWRHMVAVKITTTSNVNGFFNVALYGSNSNTRQYQITKSYLQSGKTYIGYIDVEVDVEEITKVKFLWNNSVINIFRPKVGAETITVIRRSDNKTFKFCGSGTVREDVLQTLLPCPGF